LSITFKGIVSFPFFAIPIFALPSTERIRYWPKNSPARLTTTFASHYTRTISLHDALDPETIRAYNRKATGDKFLINPSL
jgi:hypothetical protein